MLITLAIPLCVPPFFSIFNVHDNFMVSFLLSYGLFSFYIFLALMLCFTLFLREKDPSIQPYCCVMNAVVMTLVH